MYILQWDKKNKRNDVLPLYISKSTNFNCKCIHLLLLSEYDTTTKAIRYHYCWIKNLSRLVGQQISTHRSKIFICDFCLHYFHSEQKLVAHREDCTPDKACKIVLPSLCDRKLEFVNWQRKLKVPFVVYADFECMLQNLSNTEGPNNENTELKSTEFYEKHVPYSVGYFVQCNYDSTESYYDFDRGEDCQEWFINKLKLIAYKVAGFLDNTKKMIPLTSEETRTFLEAKCCHICGLKTTNADRVRDHCHLTGFYRGPAHNLCNLGYQDTRTIPVILHNLSGYDAHFINKDLASLIPGDLKLLPLNKERYISFTKFFLNIDVKLSFIDSFRHLNSSLAELASYLPSENMNIVKSEFPHITNTQFDCLTRKGIFPYEFITSLDVLKNTSLPPKSSFYSKMRNASITWSEYKFAQLVWKLFNIKNLGEYSDLYLKIDVLLLADVFENFRNSCLKMYELDPAHYCTLPGFAWDCMLKRTRVSLELLTDVNMLLFIERGIRGGLSQCSNKYSKANNKFIQYYNSLAPSTFLMHFDVNNLARRG